jgi:hypothetical protein
VPDPTISFDTEREQPVPAGSRRVDLPLLPVVSR